MTAVETLQLKKEKGEGASVSVSEKNKEQLIEDAVNVLSPRKVGNCDEYMEFASRYDDSCRSRHSKDLGTIAKDKEGHTVDDYSATECKMNGECRKQMKVAVNNKTLCLQRPTVKLMLSTHNRQDRYWTQGK